MGKFQPPCILVVTDEPLIRPMVARLLASEGLWAVTAEHGEADFDGFARIRLALILVNTYLPEMSGTEAVARVSAAFPPVLIRAGARSVHPPTRIGVRLPPAPQQKATFPSVVPQLWAVPALT